MEGIIGKILAVGFCFLLFCLLVCGCNCITTVDTGCVGVVTSFGAVEDGTLEEGIHFVAFWKGCTNINVRTQELKERADVPVSQGLTVQLEASLIYSVEHDKAAYVFQKLGPDFANTIVASNFRSAMRGATVKYEAKDLYTSNRTEIETALEDAVKVALKPYGIHVDKVLLRSVELPEKVKTSIELKLAADQAAQQMKFVIEKERLESERKAIEAEGIAKAQEKIHATLTDNYIKYLWVKALENNAQHPSTVIYVPIGPDGLPIVASVQKGK